MNQIRWWRQGCLSGFLRNSECGRAGSRRIEPHLLAVLPHAIATRTSCSRRNDIFRPYFMITGATGATGRPPHRAKRWRRAQPGSGKARDQGEREGRWPTREPGSNRRPVALAGQGSRGAGPAPRRTSHPGALTRRAARVYSQGTRDGYDRYIFAHNAACSLRIAARTWKRGWGLPPQIELGTRYGEGEHAANLGRHNGAERTERGPEGPRGTEMRQVRQPGNYAARAIDLRTMWVPGRDGAHSPPHRFIGSDEGRRARCLAIRHHRCLMRSRRPV